MKAARKRCGFLRKPKMSVSSTRKCNSMNEKLNSTKAPEPVGLYPHARKVGNLLFMSGIGPRKRGSKEIPGVELNQAG